MGYSIIPYYTLFITGASPQDFRYAVKKLHLLAALCNTKNPTEIQLSHQHCPKMPISTAVIASAALPGYFKPVDATKYLTTHNGSIGRIMLQDGGIISNIPYQCLQQYGHRNILHLGFDRASKVDNTPYNLFERVCDNFCQIHTYIFEKADIWQLNTFHNIYYIATKNIGTISFEKAGKTLYHLHKSTKSQFIKWDICHMHKPTQDIKNNPTQTNKTKFEIYPKYYRGTPKQQKILNQIYKDSGQTFFEYMRSTDDDRSFLECYEEFTRQELC